MKGSILVIDDIPDNLRLLEQTLTQGGYSVRNAINGNLALMGARAEKPDLALLDIDMPGMDGYQVCEAFQSDPALRDIPIIFLSALGDSEHKVRAFGKGGVDYISKPFQVEEVLARVEYQLTIRRQKKQIEQQNKLLEESNQRLEDFAFLVAHDLQHPLQGLMRSGKELQQNYGELSESHVQQCLDNIQVLSESMHQLVRGLLDYSRVGAGNESFELVDSQAILELVLCDFQELMIRQQAEVQGEKLPVVCANPLLLMQLLRNLIGNALKFQAPDATPLICVETQRCTGADVLRMHQPTDTASISEASALAEFWHYEVRDNGVGMDPEKRHRVFEMFHRCHSQDDYPGHGIGLSTCRKIVEHHGGQIWAVSRLGQGTSIHFTIPVTQALA